MARRGEDSTRSGEAGGCRTRMDVSSGGAGSIKGSEVEKKKEGNFASGVSLASLRSLVLVRVFEKEKGLGWPEREGARRKSFWE